MLRPNVIVPHETCFFDAVLQHLLRFGRKGDFSYDERVRIARQVTLDLHTDLIDAQTRFLQHGDCNATPIFEHTKQNVFGTEILMMMPDSVQYFRGDAAGPLQRIVPGCRMSFDDSSLPVVKASRLVENGERNFRFSDIVKHCCRIQAFHVGLG